EKDVEVKTADGVSDSFLAYPSGRGTWPAVLIWPDIGGLRPVFRDMGKRLAAQGYVVLVANPFYRSVKAKDMAATFDFSDPATRTKLMGYRGAMNDAGIANDAKAYLAFLDAQPQTAKGKKAGVQGYCMGGALSVQTAGAVPNRIGAVGSFHGGNGLVTQTPASPHLIIAKTQAAYHFATAQNDDQQQPTVKDVLKKTLDDAKRPGTVAVYAANHGWCVPGSAVYNQVEAEKAWAVLTDLYKKNLV
ncbi:MAG TPA: dienelactone hydrolase family protein, partial [Caulobacteraceae bacterium]|nr:dienelactone hydrolase family protein [Caulobacteraceae bacterium]